MQFFTIGVYNSTEQQFFDKLPDNRIDTFCDIRQRRGVRGAQYAFVNSIRLQERLRALDIKYGHIADLAPTSEIRELQKAADARMGEQKRNRNQLGEVFTATYRDKVLNKFDFDSFIDLLEQSGTSRIVFFCVEERPEACHRSLVTNRLKQLGYPITHL